MKTTLTERIGQLHTDFEKEKESAKILIKKVETLSADNKSKNTDIDELTHKIDEFRNNISFLETELITKEDFNRQLNDDVSFKCIFHI